MRNIAVTGGSGKLGVWVIKDLLEKGFHVRNVDMKETGERLCQTFHADLTNMGEAYGALQDCDAVIHLAAIPVAFLYSNDVTFKNNTVSTYNVLEAAAGHGIKKVVMASSESAYGVAFAKELLAPSFVPVTEEHPLLAEDAYGLSKIAGEETAKAFHRRTGMQVVCLRLGCIHVPEMYKSFPSFNANPKERVRNLWNYIDVRDAATACRMGVEAEGLGFEVFNIVADETCMNLESRKLLKAVYPQVQDIREPLEGYEGIISNRKAKKLLGWQPVHTWRDEINSGK